MNWDNYYMGLALFAAQKSKDPNTKVGSCIVDVNKNTVVGTGFNGFPRHSDESFFSWDRTSENTLDTKYPFVVHSELNAILNSTQVDMNHCIMYTTLFPCNECAKAIVQKGIKSVIYYEKFTDDKYRDIEKSTNHLFNSARVLCQEYKRLGKNVVITL